MKSQKIHRKKIHVIIHEVNAVAALVSKYLPAFAPHLSYYEEGCYIEKEDGRIVLVVSPDGSLRCNGNEIEIKCFFPGKTFTTPVHYGIPHCSTTFVRCKAKCIHLESTNFYFCHIQKNQ